MKRNVWIAAFFLLILLAGCGTNSIDIALEDRPEPVMAPADPADLSGKSIDEEYLEALTKTYLQKAFLGGIMERNWTFAVNIDPQAQIGFYVVLFLQEHPGYEGNWKFDADEVDRCLEQYFDYGDLENSLRYSVWYDQDTNEYIFEGIDNDNRIEATEAWWDENLLRLVYEVRTPEEDKVLWDGVLTVRLEKDGSYRYLENFMQYPEFPVTQDQNYLDEMTETYVLPLMPAYGLCFYSWEAMEDIPPDDYVSFCAFNNLLDMPVIPEGASVRQGAEYVDGYAPQVDVEQAIQQYFDVTTEYLRKSSLYEYFDEDSGKHYAQGYLLPYGYGGGGSTRALEVREEGDLLIITVGLYGPDDAPERPCATSALTVRLEEDGFRYVSNIRNE